MTLRLLVDMNLSVEWVARLERAGFEAAHWSEVGDPRAADEVIMGWAAENDHVVFTHDLGFGTLLAVTGASRPSILQVRTRDVLPERLADMVVEVLRRHHDSLSQGAIVTVDEESSRVRILPLHREGTG